MRGRTQCGTCVHLLRSAAPGQVAAEPDAQRATVPARNALQPPALDVEHEGLTGLAELSVACIPAGRIEPPNDPLKRRPGPLSITPMVVGEVPAGRMVRRGTARAGDIICVSGTLGDAALGLRLRRDPGLARWWGLSEAQADDLTSRFLRPQPRLALAGPLLAYARAAMDVSDGLMKDLGRMCRASDVGVIVEHGSLPVSGPFAAVRAADKTAAAAALFAGDDYEILTAIPAERVDAFRAAARDAGVAIAAVGQFTATPDVGLQDEAGNEIPLGATGWDHF